MTDTVEATSPAARKSGLDAMLVGELKQLGASLGLKGTGAMRKGDLVAEVIDPLSGQSHAVTAGVDGVLYARIRDRYITSGGELGKIAGAIPFRTGELLGA